MSVSIVSEPVLDSTRLYRNRPFDISFYPTTTVAVDTSLYFSNSEYGPLRYVSNGHFVSSGISTVGSLGTLSVDVLSSNPIVVTAATPQAYNSTIGVCTDPLGNVYFAVTSQNRIFKLDTAGGITPFAGTGVAGNLDGPRLTAAQFNAPAGITTDGLGTFYVTDNYRVRTISPEGDVSTLAGSATQGYTDDVGSAARFFTPSVIVRRPNGNLLVAESDSHTIRNVTMAGVVTTYAGSNGAAGYFDGSLNTTDLLNGQFVRGANSTTTLYDTQDLGVAWTSNTTTVALNVRAMVNSLDPNSNTILYGGDYSATYGSPLVYQINPQSPVVAATGLGTQTIWAIAYDPTAGVYLAAGAGGQAYSPFVSTNGGASWTDYSSGDNVLAYCPAISPGGGIWMAGGVGSNGSASNLLISASSNATAWTRTAAHNVSFVRTIAYFDGTWVVGGTPDIGQKHLATSTDNGGSWTSQDIDVGDLTRSVTKIVYGAGTWVASFDTGGGGAGPGIAYSSDLVSWSGATGAFPSTGSYVASGLFYSTTQQKFIAAIGSTIISSANGATWSGTSNAAGTDMTSFIDVSLSIEGRTTYGSARMYFPYGLLYDPAGNLYIADQYNNRVRRVAAGTNTMTTFAGTGAEAVTGGTLTTAGMARASILARDSAGTIYVGSFERSTIQTISGNNVALYAGAYFSPGYVNGTALESRFNGIAGLATFGNSLYVGEVFNAGVRRIASLPELREGVTRPAGYTIIATSNYPITINSCIVVNWSSVGGLLQLYKYEPFENTFSVNPLAGSGITLSYSTSSPELLGYLSGAGTSNVVFRSTAGANTSYTYTFTLNVQAKAGDVVVDEVSTTVSIKPGRLVLSPSNSALVFYRNEPSPNPVFSLVSSPGQLIYSATALPPGLGFVKTAASSFTLTGTPTVQSITSNYTIIALDTTGRTYSVPVSMIVNPERLIIDVTGSLSNSGLSSNVPLSPITFTSRFPPYGGDRSMAYTWSAPPPSGMQFVLKDGTPVTSQIARIDRSEDASFGLTLQGTITSTQLESFAKSGITSYPITLTGTRTAGGTPLSPSLPKIITLSFAETIFFTEEIPSLFVGLPVSNTFYSAQTYFPVAGSSAVSGIDIIDGFIPDGLDASFTPATQKFSFTGTPNAAGSYAFTLQASNARGTTAILPVTMVTSNDSLTITTSNTDTCFNFIQYRDLSNKKEGWYPSPISYTVTSRSGRPATLTGANLPAGVTVSPTATGFDLSGMPTAAAGVSTAVLTATSLFTAATATKDVKYLVSAEQFTFNDLSFTFTQNVPFDTVRVIASTLSEQPVIRFSSPSIPPALQVANTGDVIGTMLGSNAGSFIVSAFSPYSTGTNTYTYTVTRDSVLLQPTVYSTRTAPGCNVSIPINGYSLSALTVSNYRFSNPFPYGLTFNSTTGLLSGTLSTTLPRSVDFTLLGSVGFVDGSLGGTMVTDNLTVNRAQMIRTDYNGSFNPSETTLRIYSSDDNGATWTLAHSEASNVYASTIGTNGSTLYLIPTTSNFLLTSTNGASYTRTVYDTAAAAPRTSAILNKPGTSTWWMVGNHLNDEDPPARVAVLYESILDGAAGTWTVKSEIVEGGFTTRDLNETYTGDLIPYVSGGAALAYKDGVLLVGGSRILRSTDEGGTWSTVNGGFTIEVAAFSVENDTVWVATGSDAYRTGATPIEAFNTNANTVCYSVDAGLTWTYGTGGFNMNGYDLRYGGTAWMACGRNGPVLAGNYTQEVRYSFDGATWALLNAVPSPILESNPPTGALFRLGALAFDETEWKLVRALDDGTVTLYSHSYDLPMEYGWTATDLAASFSSNPPTSATRFFSYVAQTIDPGADVTTISFPFPNTGPTFVSPAQSTFILWQYMPVPTITFRAIDGGGTINYFVSPLPAGLIWDPIDRTVEGRCVELGTQTFTVYAKSDTGITAFVVTVIVEVPRIIRQQSGAGAYTSLVRQYTTVNAAQNARDTRAFPTQVRGIGEFASPYPPDVITPSNCPC